MRNECLFAPVMALAASQSFCNPPPVPEAPPDLIHAFNKALPPELTLPEAPQETSPQDPTQVPETHLTEPPETLSHHQFSHSKQETHLKGLLFGAHPDHWEFFAEGNKEKRAHPPSFHPTTLPLQRAQPHADPQAPANPSTEEGPQKLPARNFEIYGKSFGIKVGNEEKPKESPMHRAFKQLRKCLSVLT